MNNDLDHLKYLSIGYYVFAGLTALFSLFPLIYVAVGIMVATGTLDGEKGPGPPQLVGVFIAGAGFIAILLILSLAVCNFVVARGLKNQARYTFCFVIAAVNLLIFAPLGTILGVLTIIVLIREPVKELFNHGIPAAGVRVPEPEQWK